jgi:programmed cell death 6-interacting protein
VALHTIATAESVQVTIRKALSSAEKDNSTIYHDSLPDSLSLVPISGVAMVKASPPQDYYTSEKPLFGDLLPKGIRELMAQYQERLRELLHDLDGTANRITDEARSSLSALGLPASLEVLKSGGDLPDGLWRKIENVQRMGGLPELHRSAAACRPMSATHSLCRKLEDVENLAERARSTIDGIQNSIRRFASISSPP